MSFNVTNLYGMNSIGQPVINSSPIPSVVNSGSFPDLLNKPTTLTGYGISDAAPSSSVVKYYNPSGLVSGPIKIWDSVITPASSNPSIDISSAGFIGILSVTTTPANNTSTVTSIPFVSIKTYSTTNLTLNILTSNSQTISILGTLVTGLTMAASLTGMTVHVHVVGW